MANTLMSLLVTLGVDSAEFDKGIDQAQKTSKSAFGNIGAGMAGVGKAALGAGIAAGAFAGAVGVGFLASSISEAKAYESELAELNAVLASTGGVAGVTAGELVDHASALQKVTKFSDGAIIAGQSMLLTFTNIGEDVFPAATETMLNMAEKFGSVDQAAVQIGKALNDPIAGVTALRRVGVQLTDQQEEQIKSFMAVGDIASAQGVILGELETQFGGLARAAGETAEGRIEQFKNAVGDLQKMLGLKLTPVIASVADLLATKLADPAVIETFEKIGQAVADFALGVIDFIPIAFEHIQRAFGWLKDNQGLIVGALAAIGVAIAAFVYTTVIPAAIATIAATWPIILVLGLIVGAVWLLYEAWTNNWGGIQGHAAAIWAWLEPMFNTMVAWLQVNIPKALKILADFWENKLKPAIQTVWAFLQKDVFPLLQAVGEFLGTVFSLYIKALAGLWLNVLFPAISKVIDWIRANVIPVLKPVADFIGKYLAFSFRNLVTAISWVTNAVQTMTNALRGISLPDWLTPGSPTPFEIGLLGINDAMSKLNRSALPDFSAGLDISASGAMTGGPGAGGGMTVNLYLDGKLSQTERRSLLDDSRDGIMRELGLALGSV